MNFITSDIAAITVSTSGSGTDCAAPTRGLAGSPRRRLVVLALLLIGATSPSIPSASLLISVDGLRDHKGKLLYCMTRQTTDYMRCDKDPGAVHGSVAASTARIEFDNMAPGEWALLLIHDSNGNGKLDKRFGIPREGFGFSNNPAIRFGAPSAGDVRFEVPSGPSHQNVRMRYIF